MSAPDSVPPDSIPAASSETSKAAPAQKQADAARLERTIALVGMMGAGKSTVGRKLADSLGAGFVDSDEEIEKAASLTVQEIFERLGEPEFRRGERRVIERLVNGPPIVLATGGGAYLDPTTRALLKEKATTIWLRADLETIWKRVSRRDTRPLLKKPNPKQVLADLAAARAPIYAEADIVIDSGDAPASDAVRKIREALGLTV